MNLSLRMVAAFAVIALPLSGLSACTGSSAICDGVDSEAGGCDPDQPRFAGETCEDLGSEFGQQVDERVLSVVDGPSSDDASHAVRASDQTRLVTTRLSQHLQAIDLSCDPQLVLDHAKPEFSERFWEEAPRAVYDNPDEGGPPWDLGVEGYEEHLLELLEVGITWREDQEQSKA
jgi:hypothetical protein